jgi:hypothetical protein
MKRVPDFIYDEGDVGKEPMIRVLGRNPQEVVQKILKAVGSKQKAVGSKQKAEGRKQKKIESRKQNTEGKKAEA